MKNMRIALVLTSMLAASGAMYAVVYRTTSKQPAKSSYTAATGVTKSQALSAQALQQERINNPTKKELVSRGIAADKVITLQKRCNGMRLNCTNPPWYNCGAAWQCSNDAIKNYPCVIRAQAWTAQAGRSADEYKRILCADKDTMMLENDTYMLQDWAKNMNGWIFAAMDDVAKKNRKAQGVGLYKAGKAPAKKVVPAKKKTTTTYGY